MGADPDLIYKHGLLRGKKPGTNPQNLTINEIRADERAKVLTGLLAGDGEQAETMGRIVRKVWVEWCVARGRTEPHKVCSYDEMPDDIKEVDNMIGMACRAKALSELRPLVDALLVDFVPHENEPEHAMCETCQAAVKLRKAVGLE